MTRFIRLDPAPPFRVRYGNFRAAVRRDFERCCAHCYLYELYVGGERSCKLDHFYPKDKKLFPARRNDFYNLYWSCEACNSKKWNRWPPYEALANGVCFVDLCVDDFNQHYRLRSNGRLEPLTTSAAYTIATLRLNDEHLIEIRALLVKIKRPLDRRP